MNSNRGLFYSLVAHITLILVMVLQVIFYPSEALDLSRAIRVDMVDLPERVQPENAEPKNQDELPEKKLTPISTTPEPLQPPKEDPKKLPEKKQKPQVDQETININKTKQKQKEALNKLKSSSAIDKIKKELMDAKDADERKKASLKGRVLSAGTALSGLDKLQSDSYLSQLDVRIKSQWALPQWLIGKPLRTRVQIKFDADGSLISKKITLSSGNPTYDEYCLAAIEKAAPFPPVPEKFSVLFRVDGVVVGFPD